MKIVNKPNKPTAYLDQNVLDMFAKKTATSLSKQLRIKFQVVYSDETLKEIHRSGDRVDVFLNVLKDLNAAHLKLVFEQPGFIETGTAELIYCEPEDAYNSYLLQGKELPNMEKGLEQFLFKMFGGRQGDTISEVLDEQSRDFSELLDSIENELLSMHDFDNDTKLQIRNELNAEKEDFELKLAETDIMLKKNIEDEERWSAIKDYQNTMGIGAKQLNNVKSPNVLKKIWNVFLKNPDFAKANIDINEFLGVSKNAIYPERQLFDHQKVTSIYTMLNLIGYFPDSKVHKERRFVASMSDSTHASIASFCDVLFSRDEYFIKKAFAAYE